MITLALLTVLPVRGEGIDSLQIYVQAGDSCMQAFNTFEALQNYQRAYEIDQGQVVRVKLADCHYKRANYRHGVVCVDTQRYPEGLGYLNLAKELLRPDTTIMKAITLSQGEGYYLTQHYPEAVEAWKEHLAYNPSSVATYYNIANAYCYLLKDREQALAYYRLFLEKAAEVEQPTPQLLEMMEAARKVIQP